MIEKINLDEIEYLVSETVLYEIDDDSLDMSCNRSYDESDRGITYIDMGETMQFYGASEKNVANVLRHLSHKLKIDLSDLDCKNMTMSQLIKICNNRYLKN